MSELSQKIIAVTCALIIDNQNRLFAAQRSSSMKLPLKWELPGGKIEPDETAENCIIREIKEELNIDIFIIESLPPNTHAYPAMTIRLIPFVCNHINGEITLKEHANFVWLSPNEILNLDWADADIPIIKHFLNYINASN